MHVTTNMIEGKTVTTKTYEEVMQEIKTMLRDWKALPYTQEEIDRINSELQLRMVHRPHLKDYQKEQEDLDE